MRRWKTSWQSTRSTTPSIPRSRAVSGCQPSTLTTRITRGLYLLRGRDDPMSFTDAGYGQQTPSDPNTEYTSIAFIVRSMMAKMDTMKLVKVTAVHGGGGAIAAAGTVDVQPLVNQIDGASPPHATPHGTVYGIPWWRLQGGSSAVICDPIVGDLGYVICADRDISVVKGTGAVGNPGSLRRFNIADGIYVGGC